MHLTGLNMFMLLKRVKLLLLVAFLSVSILVFVLLNSGFDYSDRPPEDKINLVWGPRRDFDQIRYIRTDGDLLAQNQTSVSSLYPQNCQSFLDNLLHGSDGEFLMSNIELNQLVFNDTLGLYAFEGWRVVIWSYWDAVDMPNYIRLSILTWLCHNNDAGYYIAVINTQTAERILEGLHPAFGYLQIAHKADYIRAHLLNRFGGVWLDADTLAMASAAGQIELLASGSDFVGYTWEPQSTKIGFGVIGPLKAGNPLSRVWVQRLTAKLDAKQSQITSNKMDPFKWTEILGDIVMPLHEEFMKAETPGNSVAASLPKFTYTAIPGPWNYGQLVLLSRHEQLFSPFCQASFPSFKVTPYLMYHNQMMPKNSPLKRLTVKGFIETKTVFGKLVFDSLSLCLRRRQDQSCPYFDVLQVLKKTHNQAC